MAEIRAKSTNEILHKIRELVHRRFKRFVKNKISGSPNAKFTTETLKEQFREELSDPQKLIRDYREIALLMWTVGQLDELELQDADLTQEAIKKILDAADAAAFASGYDQGYIAGRNDFKLHGCIHGEAAQPRELKVALNFPVDADGYINIGNNDRIEAKTFIDAMKRFQETPTKATFVHERRIPDSASRPMVVGNPQTGPENRRALPKAGSEGPK